MPNLPLNSWSTTLQHQTREAVASLLVTPDNRIHFKHLKLGYACSTLEDLMHGRLVLRLKAGGEDQRFDDVESLLAAGWAVD